MLLFDELGDVLLQAGPGLLELEYLVAVGDEVVGEHLVVVPEALLRVKEAKFALSDLGVVFDLLTKQLNLLDELLLLPDLRLAPSLHVLTDSLCLCRALVRAEQTVNGGGLHVEHELVGGEKAVVLLGQLLELGHLLLALLLLRYLLQICLHCSLEHLLEVHDPVLEVLHQPLALLVHELLRQRKATLRRRHLHSGHAASWPHSHRSCGGSGGVSWAWRRSGEGCGPRRALGLGTGGMELLAEANDLHLEGGDVGADVLVDDCLVLHHLGARGEGEGGEAVLEAGLEWVHGGNDGGLAVAAEGVLEEVRELGVSVVDVRLLALGNVHQRPDDEGKVREALVDAHGLLQPLASGLGLLLSLAACKVDEVEPRVLNLRHSCAVARTLLVRLGRARHRPLAKGPLRGADVHREDHVGARRLVVHACRGYMPVLSGREKQLDGLFRTRHLLLLRTIDDGAVVRLVIDGEIGNMGLQEVCNLLVVDLEE
mmetsp:Transcript_7867/g.33095  ORF Transcript_7867/g.33095 Transcript_7867/m.33095 type:complete len:484 (-) Transcript_7867:41-1492(-)